VSGLAEAEARYLELEERFETKSAGQAAKKS
jgi:hypothetical protein